MSDPDDGTKSNGTAMAGFPWWMRAVAVIGFPAVAAVYLTWLVGQALPEKVDAVQLRVDAVYSLEQKHDAAFNEKWLSQDRTNAELISIARATCVNAAKDETARNRCLGR
jgi:hypothetical protein